MDSTNKEKTKNQTIGCISIIVIVFIFAVFVSSCGSEHNSKQNAFLMAQQLVTEKLKAPTTAKFPAYEDRFVTDKGEGNYTVASYVDSQNSFGAMIRSNFRVELKYLKENKWNSKNLTIVP